MPAPPTTDQLLDLVRKSKLVDGNRLDAFLRSLAPPLPTRPRTLAVLCVQHGLLTRFQAENLLSGRWKGFFVAGGKYKLLELLGVGGMGKVYLCEHVRMRRLVALKILPTDKLDEESRERFDREARAAGALDHPNIVRAHDMDQEGNLHFLVMEYVDGSSLQGVVKKFGPLDPVRAAHYVAQAAEGLQHAHEAGWVHRDIKPGNLLLDRAGTVKILDMGLAFFDDEVGALTKKYDRSAVLGTADYLAPEQAVDSSDVDIRADIYSLGATFYFLLTGRGPFENGSVPEKLVWHQMRAPEPICHLRPDVSRELEAIVCRMMAKKAAQRYQEPAEVVEALQPWLDQPVEPPADAEMPRRCPALEGYTLPGTSGPPSGPLSGVRRGARTGSHTRLTMPHLPAGAAWERLWWVGVGAGMAVLLIALAGLIHWAFHPSPP
jgi:serine/threonine protein kinase